MIEDRTAPTNAEIAGTASPGAPHSVTGSTACAAGRKLREQPRPMAPTPEAPGDDTPLSDAEIARSASRGAVASVTANGAVLLLQAATSLVVARLIDPRSYGVFGLSLTVIGALAFLGDLGVTARLEVLRRTELDEVRRSLGIGLAVAGLGGLIVSVIWQFLPLVQTGPPGSRFVAPVLAFTLLLTVPRRPAIALLNRRLKFRTVADGALLLELCCSSSRFPSCLPGGGSGRW